MATHSRILAWRTPWTEEPGGLQSLGCKESYTTGGGMHHTLCFSVKCRQQTDLPSAYGGPWSPGSCEFCVCASLRVSLHLASRPLPSGSGDRRAACCVLPLEVKPSTSPLCSLGRVPPWAASASRRGPLRDTSTAALPRDAVHTLHSGRP